MSVILKHKHEIELMRNANLVVAAVLSELRSMVKPGVTTAELDAKAKELTQKHSAEPVFLGYPSSKRGVPDFPGVICASVNEEIVHGVPGSRVLREGDIISIDYGARVEGYVGDSAITVPVGKVSEQALRLITVAEEALHAGIAQCLDGNRIGDISSAVQSTVEKAGFNVIRDFVGHGVGRQMHEDPQVPNFGRANQGRKLKVGMVLAIEPMIAAGGFAVQVLADGWTAVTADRSLAAHVEHSIAITEEGPYVLSRP